jgi:peptide/nickel transport system permease protein
MLDILKTDYVLAARARGIPEPKVVYRHALKNALIPVLTMMGLQFALLLAGAILTESTFSWPGMGRLLVERIYLRDYPTIQGVIVVYAFMVSIISLVVDLIYALIDPRVKY